MRRHAWQTCCPTASMTESRPWADVPTHTCFCMCCSGTQCLTFIRLGPGHCKNERATSPGHVPIRICISKPGLTSKLRNTASDVNIQRQLTPGALSGPFTLPAGPGRYDSRLLTLFLEHDNGLICNTRCSENVFSPPWSSYLLFLMWTSAYECISMPLLHLPCCHFLICIMRMKKASFSLWVIIGIRWNFACKAPKTASDRQPALSESEHY